MKFGFNDYLNMFKKRGIRLAATYFFQTHLFDILNKTDTHIWLPKEKYVDKPKNFENGVFYMSSWTRTVKVATKKAIDLFFLNSKRFALIDVGCGKGKVLCVWNQMFPDAQTIIGLEYSAHLVEICKRNLNIISAFDVDVICGDATEIELESAYELFVFYLYNPFNSKILDKFLDKISNKKAVIIYNNPILQTNLLNRGFNKYYQEDSWHPNANFAIFSNLNTFD